MEITMIARLLPKAVAPRLSLIAACAVGLMFPLSAGAMFKPSEESLSGLYPGKAYSPNAKRSFPSNVYWGDTHLHTGFSMDAGLFGINVRARSGRVK